MQRFYKHVKAIKNNAGLYQIMLDEKPVPTPLKQLLQTGSREKADIICAEWEAQSGSIQPEIMPFTKMLNVTLDKVIPDRASMMAHLQPYMGFDTLFYFEHNQTHPLYQQQVEKWTPLLEAFEKITTIKLHYGPALSYTQEAAYEAYLMDWLIALPPEDFTALSQMISLTGSHIAIILAYQKKLSYDTAYKATQLEQTYNQTHWGEDLEATKQQKAQRSAFDDAVRFLES